MVGGGIFAKGCGESWRFLMGFGAEDVACEGRCVVEGVAGAQPLALAKPWNARWMRQSERPDGRFQGVNIHFSGKKRR